MWILFLLPGFDSPCAAMHLVTCLPCTKAGRADGQRAPPAGSIGAVQRWRGVYAREHDSCLPQPRRSVSHRGGGV